MTRQLGHHLAPRSSNIEHGDWIREEDVVYMYICLGSCLDTVGYESVIHCTTLITFTCVLLSDLCLLICVNNILSMEHVTSVYSCCD